MRTYGFKIEGTTGDGWSWSVRGKIESETGDLVEVTREARRQVFLALRKGAVPGQPKGEACGGPYRITHLSLTDQS